MGKIRMWVRTVIVTLAATNQLLITRWTVDHTHHQWRSTIANVTVEAVAVELSPYKELFTTVVLQ